MRLCIIPSSEHWARTPFICSMGKEVVSPISILRSVGLIFLGFSAIIFVCLKVNV